MAKEASFCHVFLSFKGETHNKFTCFLYEALRAEGFVAFMDKSDIRVGDEILHGVLMNLYSSLNATGTLGTLDELVLILSDFDEASKKFEGVFRQQASLHSIRKDNVLKLLQCYKKPKNSNSFPINLKKCIREVKWLRTRLGNYRVPTDCILFGQCWQSISSISLLPFIDDSNNQYGTTIHEYEKELISMGVVSSFKGGARFVVNGLYLPQDPSRITPENVYSLLECICSYKPEKQKLLGGNSKTMFYDNIRNVRSFHVQILISLETINQVQMCATGSQQNVFIQNTVTLFRERLVAKFPECLHPTPQSLVIQGSSSSSLSRHESAEDKIILYTTTSINNAVGAYALVKKILRSGNVVYEERNCTNEPRYLTELKELVGNDKVRFPMVIVNGKDLCGEEEVDGFYDIEVKQNLIGILMYLYFSQRSTKHFQDIMSTAMYGRFL